MDEFEQPKVGRVPIRALAKVVVKGKMAYDKAAKQAAGARQA